MNIFELLTIKQETKYIEDSSTIRQALEKMDYYKYSVIPIISSDGTYYGTLSEGDLLWFLKNKAYFDIKSVEEIKINKIERRRSYKKLNVNTSLDELVNLSMEQNFIPIVDDRNMFIGIIRRKAIIEYFSKYLDETFDDFK